MCLLVFSVSLAFSAKVTSGLLGEGRHRLRDQAKLEVPSGRSPQITMPGACHRAGEPTGGRVHLWQEARCPVPCTTLKEPDTYRVTRDAIFSALPRTPDGFADVRGGGRRSAEEEREEPRNQRERRRGRKCACRSPVIRSARGPSRVAVIAIAIRRCGLAVVVVIRIAVVRFGISPVTIEAIISADIVIDSWRMGVAVAMRITVKVVAVSLDATIGENVVLVVAAVAAGQRGMITRTQTEIVARRRPRINRRSLYVRRCTHVRRIVSLRDNRNVDFRPAVAVVTRRRCRRRKYR